MSVPEYSKCDLPPRSLEVLKDLARCEFIETHKLGIASDSICSALERRGLARRSIQHIASDGSVLTEGQESGRDTKTRQNSPNK